MLPENLIISENIKNDLTEFFKENKYSSIAILIDENTVNNCYPLITDILPPHNLIQIPSGEENKNLKTCEHIWEMMTDYSMDRKSLLLNLGGGVISDMGGFCAR